MKICGDKELPIEIGCKFHPEVSTKVAFISVGDLTEKRSGRLSLTGEVSIACRHLLTPDKPTCSLDGKTCPDVKKIRRKPQIFSI